MDFHSSEGQIVLDVSVFDIRTSRRASPGVVVDATRLRAILVILVLGIPGCCYCFYDRVIREENVSWVALVHVDPGSAVDWG